MGQQKHIVFASLNHFNPYLCDGVSASTIELLAFLRERGHPVSILNFLTDEPQQRAVFDGMEHVPGCQDLVRERDRCWAVMRGVRLYQELLLDPNRGEGLTGEALVGYLARALQQHEAGYVLTVDAGLLPVLAARMAGLPGAHYFHSPACLDGLAENELWRRILRRRTVFASSAFTRAQIQRCLGLDAQVWYPIRRLASYVTSGPRSAPAVVGYYSSGAHKGDALVRLIAEQMPEEVFVVIGRHYSDRDCARPANIQYWGDTPDVQRLYGVAQVMLVPSLVEEGFPRVVLEAAANGIPVIANRIGGLPEALGDSGVLIDTGGKLPADLYDLAARYVAELRKLLDDHDLYACYRDRALRRAAVYEAEQERSDAEIYTRFICDA
jgi:hypothetical protein